jgi:hypothetical protein
MATSLARVSSAGSDVLGIALILAPAVLTAGLSLVDVSGWVVFPSLVLPVLGGRAIGAWWALAVPVPAALAAVVVLALTYTPGASEGESDIVTWTVLWLLLSGISLAAVAIGVAVSSRRR